MASYVIGHRNPDTDAIASALGYAWLLSVQTGHAHIAARCGPPNPQAAWALAHFGAPWPQLVTDLRPTVADVTRQSTPLGPDAAVADAVRWLVAKRQPVPVVAATGQPLALLDGADLFEYLATGLGEPQETAQRLEHALAGVPARYGTALQAGDAASEALRQVLPLEQDVFIVISDAGAYQGICRESDLFDPPRHRVVLVDHNELGQAVHGVEEAEIVEVLDHHRIAAPTTMQPIRFSVDSVGCTATLIAERGDGFPPPIAGMLLAAILSDTLVFRSPTTTARDHAAALRYTRLAGLVDAQRDEAAAMAAIADFGRELLHAGAGLAAQPPDDLVRKDLKTYTIHGHAIAIAQTEVTDLAELAEHRAGLSTALVGLLAREGVAAALLLVTNVVTGDSKILVAGDRALTGALPYARLDDALYDAPGVMSRKKQVLPAISAALKPA
jgi:manganese-dependent inorganic pyrophosphatase